MPLKHTLRLNKHWSSQKSNCIMNLVNEIQGTVFLCQRIRRNNGDEMAEIVFFAISGPTWLGGCVANREIGNTQIVAETLGRQLGASISRIEPKQPYPDEYTALTARAETEKAPEKWPELMPMPPLTSDTIYLGYPNWFGDVPPAVKQWLRQTPLVGKRIRPFVTHEGSGVGTSMATLSTLAVGATIEQALPVRGGRAARSECAVRNWLAALDVEEQRRMQ